MAGFVADPREVTATKLDGAVICYTAT